MKKIKTIKFSSPSVGGDATVVVSLRDNKVTEVSNDSNDWMFGFPDIQVGTSEEAVEEAVMEFTISCIAGDHSINYTMVNVTEMELKDFKDWNPSDEDLLTRIF